MVIFGIIPSYSLTFWPKIAHFHHFFICYQNQSISIVVISRKNTKVIALRFGQKSLIFITPQSAMKINQFQFWSWFGKIPRLYPYFLPQILISSPVNLQSNSINSIMIICGQTYQGYSLTFWPKIPHFHHLSFCNQNQSIQFWSFVGKNIKVIALLFGHKSLISSLFNLQLKSINSILVFVGKNTKVIALRFGQKSLIFITCPICNQNQSISILVMFRKIPRLYPYFLPKHRSFSSPVNLQSK